MPPSGPLPWKQGNVGVLVEVKKALKGIKWCLDGGTLLGAVREGRLFPWRACLNILIVKNYELACKRMLKIGFEFLRTELVRHDAYIAFNFLTEKADGYTRPVGPVNRMYNVKLPRHFFDKLGTATLDGISFPVPGHVEDYLTSEYGNWKVVNKHHRSWLAFHEFIIDGSGGYKHLPKGCWHD